MASNMKQFKNTMVSHHFARQYGFSSPDSFHSRLFKNRLSQAKSLFKRDLVSHFGCVNAIEFSKDGKFLTSGLYSKYLQESLLLSVNHKKKSYFRVINGKSLEVQQKIKSLKLDFLVITFELSDS